MNFREDTLATAISRWRYIVVLHRWERLVQPPRITPPPAV